MPPMPRVPRSAGLVHAGAAQGRREEGQLSSPDFTPLTLFASRVELAMTYQRLAMRRVAWEVFDALSAAEPQPTTSAPWARPQGVAASPGASAALSALTSGGRKFGTLGYQSMAVRPANEPGDLLPPDVSASL